MADRVVIGSDHGAVELKKRLIQHLKTRGFDVHDVGTHSTESVDYPDIAEKACDEYLAGGYSFGIVMCGTGIGVSISANKIRGIRCALLHDLYTAEMAKAHNNANFIAFGGRVDYTVPVEDMIDTYVAAVHGGERHIRRVSKISNLDGRV